MHEFALAEGVAVTAVEAARSEGMRRVTRLAVTIGELQQIERDVFAQILREIIPESHAELVGAELDLRTEPALLRCRACSRQFDMTQGSQGLDEDQAEAIHFIPELAHTYLRCPSCDSPDFEVIQGRGVWLESVEGDA